MSTDPSAPMTSVEDSRRELTPMERVRLAREPQRPGTLDYVNELCRDFVELHGDRVFGDDRALIGGLATFRGRSVMVIGGQGGTSTRENLARNFGMPQPEGYRKARRLMRHAEKFQLPIITFINTPAADPGIGSEERGQGTAIAESLLEMIGVRVPIVCVVIGQGGSGGALAISLGDRILMLENAIYAVAPPEACAAILWKDAARAAEAAETMRVTAADLERFGMIDELIPEPVPAHQAPRDTIANVGHRIAAHLDELLATFDPADESSFERMLAMRYEKFRNIGSWHEIQPVPVAMPTG